MSIEDLPLELIEIIASHLDYDDMVNFLSCNESWWNFGSQMLKYAKPVMYEYVKDQPDFHKYTHLVYLDEYRHDIKYKVKTFVYYKYRWSIKDISCSPNMWPRLSCLKICGLLENVIIPKHVENLHLSNNHTNFITIPSHVKHAKISFHRGHIELSEGLISLDIRDSFVPFIKLPSTLSRLILNPGCCVDSWPSNLKYLYLAVVSTSPKIKFSSNITHLSLPIERAENISLKDYLPKNLQYLKLTGIYNISLSDLPDKLTTLIIDVDNYDKSLRGILPQTLQHLEIRSNKYDISSLGYLPAGLKTLKIGGEIIHEFKRQKYVNDMVCYRMEQIAKCFVAVSVVYLLIRIIYR